MDMLEGRYIMDGITYAITDTADVHQRLQADTQFFKTYVGNNGGCIEAIEAEGEMTATGEDEATKESTPDGKMQWNDNATKLLIELYRAKKDQFRNPKLRKRDIWQSIAQGMETEGYAGLSEDLLDRKWRNLKKTYTAIKQNNNKTSTGRGRVTWSYFEAFEEIYLNDLIINMGPTISSFQRQTSSSPTSTVKSPLPRVDILSPIASKSHFVPTSIVKSPLPRLSVLSTLPSTSLFLPITADTEADNSPTPIENPIDEAPKAKKARTAREAFQFKKQEQQNFEANLEAMKRVTNAFEKQNEIQQERNELLKKFIEKLN